MKRFGFILAILLLVGVALAAYMSRDGWSRTQISASALAAQAPNDPVDHLVYRGGDATLYFVDRARKTPHRVSVPRSDIAIPDSDLKQMLPAWALQPPATRPAG